MEKIEPAWLAYALDAPAATETVAAAFDRVERHYAEFVDYPGRGGTVASGLAVDSG